MLHLNIKKREQLWDTSQFILTMCPLFHLVQAINFLLRVFKILHFSFCIILTTLFIFIVNLCCWIALITFQVWGFCMTQCLVFSLNTIKILYFWHPQNILVSCWFSGNVLPYSGKGHPYELLHCRNTWWSIFLTSYIDSCLHYIIREYY